MTDDEITELVRRTVHREVSKLINSFAEAVGDLRREVRRDLDSVTLRIDSVHREALRQATRNIERNR